jgi:hypothetical protein
MEDRAMPRGNPSAAGWFQKGGRAVVYCPLLYIFPFENDAINLGGPGAKPPVILVYFLASAFAF